jgi:hypothetical protein
VVGNHEDAVLSRKISVHVDTDADHPANLAVIPMGKGASKA